MGNLIDERGEVVIEVFPPSLCNLCLLAMIGDLVAVVDSKQSK